MEPAVLNPGYRSIRAERQVISLGIFKGKVHRKAVMYSCDYTTLDQNSHV